MSILALDIGKKRVWIAWENQGIAFPLDIVSRVDMIAEVKKYITLRNIDTIVVWIPLWEYTQGNDAIGHISKSIQTLKYHFPEIKIVEIDERYTTQIAQSVQNQMQEKNKRDDIAACIILDSYLQKK